MGATAPLIDMDEQQLQQFIYLIQTAKMPEYWLNYVSQLAYNLQVHTKGLMFDKITGLYPHEHPDSQKHCINSYESITKGSIWKAINNIIRVFNNSSYNIQISDQVRELLNQYQDKEGSFFSQFLEDWIKYAVASDPNGICVVYPPNYTEDLYRYVCYKDIITLPEETKPYTDLMPTMTDAQGNPVQGDSEDILIFISEKESEKEYVFCDVEYTKEVFLDYDHLDGHPNVRHNIVRTFNRRIEVKYLNKVWHVFTKTHFIRFYQKQAGDNNYLYDIYPFGKELESLPYFENGGIEIEYGIYESFVQPFVPFGNLALMSHRNQRAVDLMFSYPRMSEVQQPCDECHGKGQVPCRTSATNTLEQCKRCHGSGYITIQSPYKVYRKTHDSFDVDNKVFSTPSVEFYTPDSSILDYNNKQWQSYLSEAEMAVFVQQKIETGNVQAAKSKEIDREELYSWLANISKTLYTNLQMLLQYLENYLSASPIQVSVEMPYSFAILTESEAFDALNLMLASSAPVAIKANQIDNFVNKFISESSPVKRALLILKKFDLLLYYSNDELNNLRGLGIVDSAMFQKHTLAYPLLIQMYELDKTLFDLEDQQIIDKLTAEIYKYALGNNLKTALINQPIQLQQPALAG